MTNVMNSIVFLQPRHEFFDSFEMMNAHTSLTLDSNLHRWSRLKTLDLLMLHAHGFPCSRRYMSRRESNIITMLAGLVAALPLRRGVPLRNRLDRLYFLQIPQKHKRQHLHIPH